MQFLVGDRMIQILPSRIRFLNQMHFPLASPVFELFLPLDSRLHAFVKLIPDQIMDPVPFGESFHEVVFVLPNSFDKL